MLLIRMIPNSINVLSYLLVYQQVKRKKRYFIINKLNKKMLFSILFLCFAVLFSGILPMYICIR